MLLPSGLVCAAVVQRKRERVAVIGALTECQRLRKRQPDGRELIITHGLTLGIALAGGNGVAVAESVAVSNGRGLKVGSAVRLGRYFGDAMAERRQRHGDEHCGAFAELGVAVHVCVGCGDGKYDLDDSREPHVERDG